MEWQPIETAPKDENILGHEDGAVTVLYWDELQAGWRYPYKGGSRTKWFPTHWMPLPPPPQPTERT